MYGSKKIPVMVLVFSALLPKFATADHDGQFYARITNVTPNYEYKKVVDTKCRYQHHHKSSQIQSNTEATEVLGAMLIGGILGKGLTGKGEGAAVGALLGAVAAAADNNKVSQHKPHHHKPKCRKNKPVTQKVLKNYRIEYVWNGVSGSSYTYNHYSRGDYLPITVNINAK
jgi:uncharacterized protein YcfJ